MHRLESALGTVLGSDGGTVCGRGHVGPSRWSPCWTTVVAFERLRQTHVRVKNRESPFAMMCLGVWLTRRLPNKRAHCCTLHRRMATSRIVAPVCHLARCGPGSGSPSVRESHVPSLSRSRYLRMRCSDTAVRRVRRAPGRSYGTCQCWRDTGCRACMSCQSLHVVLGLLQQPRSCGPPGLRARCDRLCWGLLRGAHGAQRCY